MARPRVLAKNHSRLQLRLDPDDLAALEEVMDKHGLTTKSDTIRWLLHLAADGYIVVPKDNPLEGTLAAKKSRSRQDDLRVLRTVRRSLKGGRS